VSTKNQACAACRHADRIQRTDFREIVYVCRHPGGRFDMRHPDEPCPGYEPKRCDGCPD